MTLPQQEWQTLIPGAHAGYVSWEDYQHNQERLHENAQAMGVTGAGAAGAVNRSDGYFHQTPTVSRELCAFLCAVILMLSL